MPKKTGFTLIELLVVIALLAILAVIGVATYSGLTKNARDAKRKADVDTISKAYEVNYQNRVYPTLIPANFASGGIPKTPAGDDYYNVRSDDGAGFKVCAALEGYPSTYCNSSSPSCYCKTSAQGTINTGTAVSGPGYPEVGYSSSTLQHPTSCDPNGTLDDGLVGYWRMDEAAGSTNAVDSAGNNTGVYNNGATTVSRVPLQTNNLRSGSFDGSNDYIDVGTGNSLRITSSLTISAWIKTNFAGTNEWIFSKLDPVTNKGYEMFTQNGTLRCGINNGGSYSEPSGGPFDDQWHYLTCVYDQSGNLLKLYVDGSFITEVSYTGGLGDNTTNAKVGQRTNGGGSFQGQIDDLRIYNRALSQPEIAALNGTPPGSGCIP